MTAGLDSLGAVEVKNSVAARFGIILPATLAFDFPTLQVCARYGLSLSAITLQQGEFLFKRVNLHPLPLIMLQYYIICHE